MTTSRMQNRESYWQMQTQVENKFFQDYREERHWKQHSDLNSWRTKIIIAGKRTQEHMKYLDKKEKNTLKAMQLKDIGNMSKTISDKIMLDALQLEETKRWPKLGKLDQSINLDLIFPQNILNFGEYQEKIQKLALYADVGDSKGMQSILDNNNIIEKKNKLLQPLFRDIKSQIRHMTHTPEYELMREYISKRQQILNSARGQADKNYAESAVGELRKLYGVLLAKRKLEIESNLSLQLKTIKARLDGIYELLMLWKKYTDIIYMPEAQLNFVELLEKMDIRPDQMAYKNRMTESDIATRLNMLFGKGQGIDETEAASADYETVNEGSTTDTTSGLDEDTVRSRHIEHEKMEKVRQKPGAENMSELGLKMMSTQDYDEADQSDGQKQAPEVQEGIQSSDEDDQTLDLK